MEIGSISYIINSVINRFGIEIHRYIPEKRAGSLRSMYDVCMQARKCGLSINTVIDVGVATGTPYLYKAFSDCEIILIEPISEFDTDIAKIVKNYNCQVVKAAASDKNGKTPVSINKANLHGTSLLSSLVSKSPNMEVRDIETVRIDDLSHSLNLSGPFVIKADVQGTELKVVEGARGMLEDTEMIILETSFYEFSPGNPQFYDVIQYMKDLGFVVYDFIGGAIRPLDGSLGQIDVAFVKESGVLRKDHSYGSFK